MLQLMAKKVALLVGVSDYACGLSSLPGAARDVEAMRRILLDEAMGGFDQAIPLINPDRQTMEQSIEKLFCDLDRNDLVLLFFSGHGIKDDSGNLYLATRITEKNTRGQLTKSTAVPANFIHDIMDSSRSRRQVVVLDCCFSGAFAEGMKAKDDGFVDVRKEFGGEGRAVLTSSTSTQYSFEQDGSDLSIYTHYLIEGIETGAADLNKDDWISVDELHEYAGNKVREIAPAMKPEIYVSKEGYNIHLSKAPACNPKARYRKEVEQFIERGQITEIGRTILENLRSSLNISLEEAAAIEARVLQPYRDYQNNLNRYEVALLSEARSSGYPLKEESRKALRLLQRSLQLKSEDVVTAEELIFQQITSKNVVFPYWKIFVCIGIVLSMLSLVGWFYWKLGKNGIKSYHPLLIVPELLTTEECLWLVNEYDRNNLEVRKAVGLTESETRTSCKKLNVRITEN